MYLSIIGVRALDDYYLKLTVECPGGIDLDPEILYEKSKIA
jgi:hypothetical protein